MEEAVKTARSTKRSWRLRWSLRAFVVGISLPCVLFGWVAYQSRLGSIHQDVANQLYEISATPRPQLPADYVPGQARLPSSGQGNTPPKPLIIMNRHVQITWKYGTTHVLAPGEVTQFIRPDIIFSSFYSTLPLASVHVPDTPVWMQWSGTENAFQRIRSIDLTAWEANEELDRIIEQISRLEHLERLHLSCVSMTPDQFSELVSHVDVESLDFSGVQVDLSQPIAGLRECSIASLDLSDTNFSDAAVADLPDSLVDLELRRTSITDAGIAQLTRLEKLETLSLLLTPTNEAAVESLRKELPRCEIKWKPRDE